MGTAPQPTETLEAAPGGPAGSRHLHTALAEAKRAEVQVELEIRDAMRRYAPAREMRALFARRAAVIEALSAARRRIGAQQELFTAYHGERGENRVTLKSPIMKQVYSYWASKKGDRGMPDRRDLDPIEMRPFLSALYMVDVEREPTRYRYRLEGTALTNATSRNLTGRYLDETTFGEGYDLVARAYDLVVQHRLPLGRSGRAHWIAEREWMYTEFLLLPLGMGSTVDVILGCFSVLPASLRENEQRTDYARLQAGLNPLFG